MANLKAHAHVVGAGPTVMCLHSSASSSKQWRPLAEGLAGRYRVIAADLLGYGQSPAWSGERKLSLSDEVALLEPWLQAAAAPVRLIGHSFGAAVAMRLALRQRQRVDRLVVYEPVLFNLLHEHDPTQTAASEAIELRTAIQQGVRAGDLFSAGRRFIDYWSGDGTWQSLPERQRQALAGRMLKVAADFDAIDRDAVTLSGYAAIDVPVLLLSGTASPAPTRRIAALLESVLPRVQHHRLGGLGHMGPVTHADAVNELIADFVDATRRSRDGIDTRRVA